MAASALDLKMLLSAIDRKDYFYYSKLSDEEKKAFVPWTVMRFLSSANNDLSILYTVLTNEVVNEHFSKLSKHPELQMMLMAICGAGSKQYHPWIKPPRRQAKNKFQEILQKQNPRANSKELDLLESLYSVDQKVALLQSMGMNDKEIKELLK